MVYADYTASGRALRDTERFVTTEVLPWYANTHTTTSVTSLQTTRYRHEARDIVRNATNASEHDAVIFVGAGVTGAIHKLVHALQVAKLRSSDLGPVVVFISPFEHHSNILPWREAGATIVRIAESSDGLVDIGDLRAKLKSAAAKGSSMLIGAFSAASNVTGILVDTDAVSACLHEHGALAVWDYATAGPYCPIDMNSKSTPGAYKDAVVVSPHKFVGGVAAQGVLVAKKALFRDEVPEGAGGGSVFYVTRDGHRYLQDIETREEGGTPDIVGSVRAGQYINLLSRSNRKSVREH